MANFFISRPIFAVVLAIIAMLAGIISLLNLPVEQYPDIAPPAVTITATYPGASAKAVEDAVTQVIEQQMKGIDNLRYISASSSSDGAMSMTLTFESGTDPDIAQVQVQNKLALATPLLPAEVQRQGVIVDKAQTGFLMIVALSSEDGSYSQTDLADYIASNMQDPLSRVPGVGAIQLFASQYAMRIWLDPFQLANYGLSPNDVVAAVRAQNTQVTGGEIGGGPIVEGQQLNATITIQSLMQTPEEFRAIALRTLEDGSQVTVGDVATVELGSANYTRFGEFMERPAAGMAVQLATGANALETAEAVKERVAELAEFLPPKMTVVSPYDTTPFIKESIKEVVKTLIEAAIFVSIIMFLFLQNMRATAIVMITVPVVLLGTMAILLALGFSINTLSMLAMVLAIGLLVDDAIVVIENVDRIMEEEKLPAKEATQKAMGEISGALVGIGAVLSAVFIPMAFFGGTAGVIYREFSVTIVSAMVLSVITAIILTPALCAVLLKPVDKELHAQPGTLKYALSFPLRLFNRVFNAGAEKHLSGTKTFIRRAPRFLFIFIALTAVTGFSFTRLQGAFLPNEDQGIMMVMTQLPAGATFERTMAVNDQVEDYLREGEKETVETYFTLAGMSFSSVGQNVGLAFINLKDWEERKGADEHVQAVIQRAMGAFQGIRDGQVFAFSPPAVPGLGQAEGFDFYLQDRGGKGHAALIEARNQLLGMAAQNPTLVGVRPNGLNDVPQLKIDVDQQKAQAMGLSIDTINSSIATAMGSLYVNDFLDRGRIKRVYIAADSKFRKTPEDLNLWRIPNASGELVPFSAFADVSWTKGSPKLERYNGVSAVQILGAAAAGISSGQAMNEIEKIAAALPDGFGIEWTGVSAEERESGAKTPMLYALSILVVFLCLAALYESWSIPISVLMVVPLGVMGATFTALFSGLANDIFFQVGLLTTIGLSAKNAILIVEFANILEERGRTAVEAAIEAARTRLRPILMTSFAFGLGVTPLALSSGAGAAGRNAIGTSVLGGMIAASLLGLFFTPLFYVLVRRFFGGAKTQTANTTEPQEI
ncbi:efflux RND transporter permease subunit [Hyphococcus sp. DH-69]|uniref:efflux RND transporter permease subunit n=1 Tax=Hyphococcus formosus TaxID=3143534 RepID=UPI00398BACB6